MAADAVGATRLNDHGGQACRPKQLLSASRVLAAVALVEADIGKVMIGRGYAEVGDRVLPGDGVNHCLEQGQLLMLGEGRRFSGGAGNDESVGAVGHQMPSEDRPSILPASSSSRGRVTKY